ncbi:MAG: ABC transporter ATP-binding protein [Alphaproteobacteria bacterium]
MTVLRIENAVKIRGDRETVSHVSLDVAPGERIALLGHNGAGKTTLIRMILGLTPMDGGHISIAGHAPGSLEARRTTAFLPENVAFHPALTGKEQLRHFARLRGESASRADDLLERVGLKDDADRRIAAYSKGMRQRLGLAQALLGHPRLSLLDEPTSGLDPIARWDFYDLVEEFAASGGAVLLSSHALTELEARTDRIVILRSGKLVANGNLESLRRAAELPLRLRIVGRPDSAESLIANLGGQRINGCSVELACPIEQKMERLAAVNAIRDLVEDIEIIPPGLDDLYRHFSAAKEIGQ